MRRLPLPFRHPRGFSLAELMIAMAVGLIILAGMTTLFINNARSEADIEAANRQVENGRYAIDVLVTDLRNAGYYAEFNPTALPDPADLPLPCAASTAELQAGLTLPVQGLDNDGTALPCLADVRPGTDVLVVRRVRTCIAGTAGCDPLAGGGPFFQASLCNNASELESPDVNDHYDLDLTTAGLTRSRRDCTASGSGTPADVRRYLTHIYFIANNNQSGDGIPTLKRAELASDGAVPTYAIVPLAEGIEQLHVEYGLDLVPGFGVPDLFSADPAGANGCTAAACAIDNWQSVVALKLHLLARNTTPTQGHQDKKSYVLGLDAGGNPNTIAAADDNYKRHVFQTLVTLPNPTGRRTR